MSDIFISYSRLDKDFVAQLREAFSQQKQDVWIDWESIAPSRAWWDEIKRGIAICNNFIVIMSPNSMSSPVCHMEIEHARALGKRIIPVLYAEFKESCINKISKRLNEPDQAFTRELWGTRQEYTLFHDNQQALAPLNYFFFSDEDNFQEKFTQLMAIIRTDFDHKEAHTRLGLRAEQWATRKRDVSFLLTGEELKEAKFWLENAINLNKNPQPTPLQIEYIETSDYHQTQNEKYLFELENERQTLAHKIVVEHEKLGEVENSRIRLLRRIRLSIALFSILVIGLVILVLSALQLRQTALTDLDIVNTQVGIAQATVTQASIIENIVADFSNILIKNRDNIDKQIAELNLLVGRYPNESRAYHVRGVVYGIAKMNDEAIADFTRAIEMSPQSYTNYYNRGIVYANMGKYDEAIADFTQAIELDANSSSSYHNRGAIYYFLKNYDEAIADFNHSLALDNSEPSTYHNIGLIYYELANYQDSVSAYTQALLLDPELTGTYYNRGLAYAMLAKSENNITLQRDYAQHGIDDFRMAEALGVDFDEETRQFWTELEGLLAENTPTPTP